MCLVTATIRDAAGNPYVNAIVIASFVGQSIVPGAGPYVTGGVPQGQFETVIPSQTDSFGAYSMTIPGNDTISPSPSQWRFTVVSNTIPPVAFAVLITLAGASQDISAAMQAAAASLNPPTGFGNITALSILSKNIENMRFADRFAAGSSTGGIQEAVNDIGANQGEVWITSNTACSVAINMAANINVRGIGKNIIVRFTGVTDGFVWPNTANYAGLYNLTLQAENPNSGKAINITDAASAAIGIIIEGVKIQALNAPTNKWAYGFYLSNAIFETINNCYIQSATISVHTDGTTNATYFNNLNSNSNLAGLTTCLELQGGDVHFVSGDIEGQYSNALAEITQPGAAGTHIFFVNTRFENHTATGKGIHCNVGRFEAYGILLSIDGAATAIGFVIGDTNQTNDCKVIGGEGIGWTLGASASGNVVTGYTWDNAITPVDNSTPGTNNVFLNHAVGAGNTYASSSFQDVPNFNHGTIIPNGQFYAFSGQPTTGMILASPGGALFIRNNNVQSFNIDASGNVAVSGGLSTFLSGPLRLNSTTALITQYGNLSTAGQGVSPIYGATSQKSESAADANVLTFVPPAVIGKYRVSFVLDVSAAAAAVLGWTITYKDSNGNAVAPTNLAITQLGTAVPALTFTTSASSNYSGSVYITTDATATAIVIKFTLASGTITAKASAAIERLI